MLRELLEKIGCGDTQENTCVAHLAIDILKQLSLKFLQKTELSHYSFQRVFLNPFLVILDRTSGTYSHLIFLTPLSYADSSLTTLELLLSCVRHITIVQYANLKSGWTVIVEILTKSLTRAIATTNHSLITLNAAVSTSGSVCLHA